DHQGITGNCASCHDGNTATGQPGNHFVTTEDCNVCHSTNGWAPANNYTHANNSDYPGDHNSRLGLTCSSCHTDNDETIRYPSPTYAPFCAACHERDFEPESDHNGGKAGTVAQNKNCAESGCHRVSDRQWD
ncbi:MAG: cytochrome c3 family protein, partial [Gammaproteobacteria bacterium]|nr:cytochrome c3 family protein [Gammaproteobacteria bacterium]